MTQKPISPSLVARAVQAAHYVISGVAPDSWFGPNQPLEPIAPDNVAGRRFDYPTGYNLNYTPRSAEPLSFADLRALADNCDILRSVIETRKDQVEALNWSVRVKPAQLVGKRPTPEQASRISTISEFLQSPDKENSFGGWLRQLLEDIFVIDAGCIYKRTSRDGQLYALELIDGATIKILIDDTGRTPLPPDPAYQQVLKGVPAVDYTRDELMYLRHNPRSHKVYGYSHVEQVVMTVNILIRRALHQLEYYRDGSQPDAFIGLPKEWNQDQIVAFQKHFDAMLAGNSAMRRRLRFMPGEFKYQETKTPLLKDTYDEFLARIICYVFSVSPEPFVSHVNRATAESSQSRAMEEGLAPLMRYVSDLMNRVIRADFSSPDLEFIWQDMREQDPKEAADIDVAYVGAGIMTPDEVRSRLGLMPISEAGNRKPEIRKFNKYNPYHLGAGPGGGQFTTRDRDGESNGLPPGAATGRDVASAIIKPSGRRIHVAANDTAQSDAIGSAFSNSPQYVGEPDNDRIDSSNMLEYIATAIGGLETLGVEGAVSLASRVRSMIGDLMSDSSSGSPGNTVPTHAPDVGTSTGMTNGGDSATGLSEADAEQLADQIANGHAYDKHTDEFPDISSRDGFSDHIQDILENPDATKKLPRGRTAYWDSSTGTIVFRDPASADGGTAFKPESGKDFFDSLKLKNE